jgi:hypothetical protein
MSSHPLTHSQVGVTSDAPSGPLDTSSPTGSSPITITYTARGVGTTAGTYIQTTVTRTIIVLNPCSSPELLCNSPRVCTVGGVCPSAAPPPSADGTTSSVARSDQTLASFDLVPPVISVSGSGSDLVAGGRVVGRATHLQVGSGTYVDAGKQGSCNLLVLPSGKSGTTGLVCVVLVFGHESHLWHMWWELQSHNHMESPWLV